MVYLKRCKRLALIWKYASIVQVKQNKSVQNKYLAGDFLE